MTKGTTRKPSGQNRKIAVPTKKHSGKNPAKKPAAKKKPGASASAAAAKVAALKAEAAKGKAKSKPKLKPQGKKAAKPSKAQATAAPKPSPRKPTAQRSRVPPSGPGVRPRARPETPQDVIAQIDDLKSRAGEALAGIPDAEELIEKVKAKAMAKAPTPDRVAVLGHALWLMTQIPTHKHLFIGDMEWLLIPPVSLGQFRLWRQGNMPVAMATWAFVSPAVDKRLSQGGGGLPRLTPLDWKSGNALWLMDILAPFGGQENVIKDLKEKVFPDRTMKTLQPAEDGGGMNVVEW